MTTKSTILYIVGAIIALIILIQCDIIGWWAPFNSEYGLKINRLSGHVKKWR